MQYSIVYFSEAKKERRFDAEFYKKSIEISKSINLMYISEILDVIQYGISIDMNEEKKGIPIYRMNEINDLGYLCSTNVQKYAYIINDNDKEKFLLNDKDVLFNRTNSFDFVGRTGIFYSTDNIKKVFASYLIRLVPNKLILPEFLVVYLNTNLAISEIKKRARISINQSNVSASELVKIKIPIFSDEFQKSIEKLVLEAHNQRQKSNSLMKEANEILEKEIGFDKLEIKKKKVNYSIVNYRETLSSKRIDAEYYQEKYKIIMDKIQSYKNGCIKITDLNSINNKLISIDKNKKYEYIELSNIDSMGFINNLELYYGYELPSRARRLLNNNDVIISSVEGSLDKSSLIYNNNDNLLCSTGFLVFNENEFINPETLFCFFRLALIKELLKKISKGTILTAFDSNAICDMEIPNLDKNVQNVIAEKVQDAYKARDKAKALLEEAKKKVEDAIENGE
ncbi:hypothetical protein [Brachyspira hyodysenteriae]|uniref:restriction endonuclease subunit S n=1 Tax=Brachyspira hyodysenteriae TaxID=159 RepID=UPI001ADD7D71|nr:hypothetical protein [Brachyspira hyodysenteriae]MCZ9920489.1 hypothetical protein [Brachyspira hyodysenteriae]MCZ9962521.1 hypothetical protein [Brachyspira hyodysenteriae]MCZ9965147.1 hypothetical protein [Brachyspira hyodysenteriae]MDA0158305.1 hypothetical protein [Brachyspira hyodysenteriae]QTM09474.1 hypothetical protein GQX60_11525 [Brachyspira hyodysenteriae]